MLISLLILLLLSNALTLRKDKSILFSRVVIIGLLSTSFVALNNLFMLSLDKGIGIYEGLFNVTPYTQTFNIFIFIISALILTLTAFISRKNKYLNIIASMSITSSYIFLISGVFFRAPLLLGIQLLGIEFMIPILSGLTACVTYILSTCIMGSNKSPEMSRLFIVFFLSASFSLLIFYFVDLFSASSILECIHPHIVGFLGLSEYHFRLHPINLFAESSPGGASGYEGEASRSPSTTVQPGEAKLQYGGLVPGLSYSEVQSIRSNIHSFIVTELKNKSSVFLSDVLNQPSLGPNTHKVMLKAYSLANIKFDVGCVVATRNLGPTFSVNYSPPVQEMLNMR